MPPLGPVSRRELISRFRELGFRGPVSGSKHQFMLKASRKVFLPNPHVGSISTELLAKILKQAGLSRQEWEGTGTS